MSENTSIVAQVEAFSARTGLAETTIGSRAVQDSRVMSRLRQGRVTLQTVERLLAFMRRYDSEKVELP